VRIALALLLVSGCSCGEDPLANTDTGVPPIGVDAAPTECAIDEDCAFGEVCLGGACVGSEANVSDMGCRADGDCPSGFECAEATGQCVASPNIPEPPPPTNTSSCAIGSTRVCGTKIGACEYGTETCTDGTWGMCMGGVTEVDERCNAVDDDCDGDTDEDFDVGGSCTAPIGGCQGTGVIACAADEISTECTNVVATGSGETCNDADDDCDTMIDEGCDDDGDDYCDVMMTIVGTPAVCPETTNAATRDCNDADPAINPGATEICQDQRDQNCDGNNNDGCAPCNVNIDADLDGSNQCLDCDETNGAVRPGATEACDGIDNDCDTMIDETFDMDGDTYTTCGTRPSGGLSPALIDCADNNPNRYPGACELCALNSANNTVACGANNDRGNNVDEDCDGYLDETCSPCSNADPDGDTYSECEGDCQPANGNISPGRAETCDGFDTDCNATTMENCGVGETCNWPGTPPPDACRADLLCVESLGGGGNPTGDFTCTSFCNTSLLGLGLGDGCESNQACLSSLTPTANLHGCTLSTDIGASAVGANCNGDTDCRSADCLRDQRAAGPPVEYCSDLCGNDSYCAGNTTCQAWGTIGRCWRELGVQDRAIGASCNDGQTVRCEGGPNTCITVAANNRICSEVCCENNDCPGGYFCSVRGPDAPGPVGGYDTVPVCWPNSTGQGNRVAGQACTSNLQCRANFCDRTLGVCVDICCNDSSCPAGLTCESAMITRPDGHQLFGRACVNLTPAGDLEAL
jgi:hypothetical protein